MNRYEDNDIGLNTCVTEITASPFHIVSSFEFRVLFEVIYIKDSSLGLSQYRLI